jgi:hypothetical protein
MNRTLLATVLGAVPALALTLVPATAHAAEASDDPGLRLGHDLIRADLVPSHPTDQPIDGVNPGALPWQVQRGEVRIRPDGRTDVRIEGLQVPRADGTADNPVPMVDAVVYCAGTEVADSGPQLLSVPDGDTRFRVFLNVPRSCTDISVLISPSAAVGHAYIASATAD